MKCTSCNIESEKIVNCGECGAPFCEQCAEMMIRIVDGDAPAKLYCMKCAETKGFI